MKLTIDTVLALAMTLLLLVPGRAQNAADRASEDRAAEEAKRFQAHARQIATAHELHWGDANGPLLALNDEPILRWANPLGGKSAHGEVFLWTHRGRPAAVLSVNEFTGVKGQREEEREWHSLASGPLAAVGPDGWAPVEAGIELKNLPAAPGVADSAVRRLRQMRDIAGHFSGEKTTRTGQTRPLRLLTQPAFRFEAKDTNVVDGALFALVEANDPEVFLVLEARAAGAAMSWQYAVARMNSVRVALSYEGQPLWEAPALPGKDVYNRKDKPYAAFLTP